MMISTRGRYALRVMVDLAEHTDGSFIAMKEVAERQQISLKYLERILPLLVEVKLPPDQRAVRVQPLGDPGGRGGGPRAGGLPQQGRGSLPARGGLPHPSHVAGAQRPCAALPGGKDPGGPDEKEIRIGARCKTFRLQRARFLFRFLFIDILSRKPPGRRWASGRPADPSV